MSDQEQVVPGINTAGNTFSVTQPMLLSLRQTKPWVKLLSILGFISIGFLVLMGLINMFSFSKTGAGSGFMFIPLLINILMGVLYFFPSLYLYRYNTSIGQLLGGGGTAEMEMALSYQKSFWKFFGIMVLISMVFAVIGIIAAIAIPQFMAYNR